MSTLIAPIDQCIIDFIRLERMARNISQADLANMLQLSRSFISSAESPDLRAKYNVQHINILARLWKISPRDFLPEQAVADKQGRQQSSVLLSGQ
ncbi:MAG: XRE family transcriptional regulator [Bacteroidetes bacterium]|nr:XRE family transcriptional regulator [Bacteroidota bacterium]